MNTPLRVVALIPARLGASRFPAKLLQDLGGKPVILRTYEATVSTGLFDKVIVVTDNEDIYNLIHENGGHAIRSIKNHESGSDRIAEAASDMEVDVVVNVQGDEPLIDAESLKKVIAIFRDDTDAEIDLASLMVPLKTPQEVQNPNHVKVIVDARGFALYFSRSPIPYVRDHNPEVIHYKHKGVYAFRKQALLDFTTLPMGKLESAEKIEALRFLEHGRKIKMVETSVEGIEIDTPEDLEKARLRWK